MNLIEVIYHSLGMGEKKKSLLYVSLAKVDTLWKNVLKWHYTEILITER